MINRYNCRNLGTVKFQTKGLKNIEQLEILFHDIIVTIERTWPSSRGFRAYDVDDPCTVSEIEDKMIEDPRDSSHDLSLNNILQSFKTTTQPTTYGKQE